MIDIKFHDLGLSEYQHAWKVQNKLFDRVAEERREVDGYLIHTRHPPIITRGKSSRADSLPANSAMLEDRGVQIIDIDRGGGVTYHGPGQVILYPILDLHQFGKDLRGYVHALETAMSSTATSYGLSVETRPKAPGLWIEGKQKKLGSIGIRIEHWITMHGLAFNVDIDTDKAGLIHPCGFRDVELASLTDYVSTSRTNVKQSVIKHLTEELNIKLC